jgi:hypothetical protein
MDGLRLRLVRSGHVIFPRSGDRTHPDACSHRCLDTRYFPLDHSPRHLAASVAINTQRREVARSHRLRSGASRRSLRARTLNSLADLDARHESDIGSLVVRAGASQR